MRVVRGKLSPVAGPADVDEVRGRLFHAGHPGVVDQGEGDAVLVQQFWQVGAEPAPVAHLDGVARSLRQDRQEIFEDAHAFDRERWRELQQERAEPVAEEAHRLDKGMGGFFGAHQFFSCVISWEFCTSGTKVPTLTLAYSR